MASFPKVKGVENLGCSLSSGTFTIHDDNGNSLTTANPGWVTLPSKGTPGQLVRIPVTANQAFIDDAGSSEIINNLFGMTTGAAITQDMPFYIYAVSNDDEDAIAFMLARIPHAETSPVAAAIGAPDDAVADAQGDFFSFDSLDETLYDSNPCMCIGAIRMRMSASDDWTIQTLRNKDGIGCFHEATEFGLDAGLFGCASGKFFLANGGTAPSFSTQELFYRINRWGMVDMYWNFQGDGGTDGSGAVITWMMSPFDPIANLGGNYCGVTRVYNQTNNLIAIVQPGSTGNKMAYLELDGTAGAFTNNADFSNGDRIVQGFARLQPSGASSS